MRKILKETWRFLGDKGCVVGKNIAGPQNKSPFKMYKTIDTVIIIIIIMYGIFLDVPIYTVFHSEYLGNTVQYSVRVKLHFYY